MTTALQEHRGSASGTLFRLATAGSVDDGKSTLVGRLLHDSKAILADQLEAVARTSAERGFGGDDGGLDLALLTDGLRAEREQGITIDVAYRYFATDRRTFVLADCPGHVQYTRNTVTGASTADAVVVLVDARHGVLEQTRRHLSVVHLLRVPHVIVAVNKIDLVDYSEEVFTEIAAAVRRVAGDLGLADAVSVPVSALRGDNVVERSEHTPWYSGPTLMELLESAPSADDLDDAAASFRFPVQLVVRPQGALAPGVDPAVFRDYRAYGGQIAAGTVRRGDTVALLTPGQPARTTTVAGIDAAGHDLEEATAPQSVSLRLAGEFDVARGDLIAAAATAPTPSAHLTAEVCWLAQRPLRAGASVLVKHGTATVRALVQDVEGRLDLELLRPEPAQTLELNDIGRVRLKLSAPLPVEPYAHHRRTGAFLVIDPQEGNTVAAGMVLDGRADG